ncbi:MAG: transglutaminase family protein [Beijerinckiaceae bacterium]|nr:transglutaminase family protein [Beijerinckiaceae bacterium]
MRIHIRHEIAYAFEPPVRFLNAALRLTPRSHESQHVARWRVEIDGDSRIRESDDAFGNCMHTLSLMGPSSALHIVAEGIIETFDAAGIVRATVERFPPDFYLRETPLTAPGESHRALTAGVRADNPIERLHELLLRMEKPEGGEQTQSQSTSQAQSQSQKQGEPAQADPDAPARATHDFIICARLLGAPARFVSGYYIDPKAQTGAAHCWAEAHVEGVGWIGFDAVNLICPHESHARMAIGLDSLDAAGVRAAPMPASFTSSAHVTRADARQS